MVGIAWVGFVQRATLTALAPSPSSHEPLQNRSAHDCAAAPLRRKKIQPEENEEQQKKISKSKRLKKTEAKKIAFSDRLDRYSFGLALTCSVFSKEFGWLNAQTLTQA
jgi:hypothetical protein